MIVVHRTIGGRGVAKMLGDMVFALPESAIPNLNTLKFHR